MVAMSLELALWLAAALLILAVALAAVLPRLLRRESRGTEQLPDSMRALLPQDTGEQLHLILFSTKYCTRCPGVARALGDFSASDLRFSFQTVDLTEQPKLAEELHILQTPTVFAADQTGTLRYRLSGTFSSADLTTSLTNLLEERKSP